MTPIAALVAEALAFAEANTDGTYAPSRFCVIRTDRDYVSEPEWGGAVPESFAKPGGPRVAYGRADFTLVALAHLAERASRAEERAARAEADLRRMETRALTFGAALQGIAASGDDKPTNASMFAEAVLLVEKKAAPNGLRAPDARWRAAHSARAHHDSHARQALRRMLPPLGRGIDDDPCRHLQPRRREARIRVRAEWVRP